MNRTPLEAAVTIARALGHPARLRIVGMLRSGELCVCQVTAVLELAPSTVSAHLRELKRAGLVVERKEGRWVHFGLAAEPELRSWVDTALGAIAGDPGFAADERVVAELRELPLEDVCHFGLDGARARWRCVSGKTCRERAVTGAGRPAKERRP